MQLNVGELNLCSRPANPLANPLAKTSILQASRQLNVSHIALLELNLHFIPTKLYQTSNYTSILQADSEVKTPTVAVRTLATVVFFFGEGFFSSSLQVLTERFSERCNGRGLV
jgi:hypothetical protein